MDFMDVVFWRCNESDDVGSRENRHRVTNMSYTQNEGFLICFDSRCTSSWGSLLGKNCNFAALLLELHDFHGPLTSSNALFSL